MYLHCRDSLVAIMEGRVQKWGNSLALRIPAAFARQAGLGQDSSVDISVEGDRIVIKPARPQKYRLADLVAAISDDNVHGEVDSGSPVGGEAW